MDSFNLVIFGFTSNLSQLKIIPALYDLEEKKLLAKETKIIGIGRKPLNIGDYINNVLNSEGRHHKHSISSKVKERLISRVTYLREDFENKSGELFLKLKTYKGNHLYYLATYPDLYQSIFESLKKYKLNTSTHGWVKIMIEKPFGQNLSTATKLNKLLNKYFNENQIFRVDHYLGKESLRKIFNLKINPSKVDRVEISISENFGIGKRGIYYDATGALIDMGQNHVLQMLAAVIAKSVNPNDRAKAVADLVVDPSQTLFGQYKNYLDEENIPKNSTTDTFFALKTHLSKGRWKGIPFYLSSGKMLQYDQAKIIVFLTNNKTREFIVSPLKVEDKFDPYERLLIEAVKGDQTYFNNKKEIEASWKFIDKLIAKRKAPFIYKKGTDLVAESIKKLSA